ncbi:MAG: DUF1127 domain-containing protein [Pseudomonadota bacterium]
MRKHDIETSAALPIWLRPHGLFGSKRRRRRASLPTEMSDHLLKDIGLHRTDLLRM